MAMFSDRSKFCVRLAVNLALAVSIPILAATAMAAYRQLAESAKDIARARDVRESSQEARLRVLNTLLDKAIDNSRKKDALMSDILHLLGFSCAVLLFAAVRNTQLGFALDRSRQTVLQRQRWSGDGLSGGFRWVLRAPIGPAASVSP